MSNEMKEFLAECKEGNEVWNFIGLIVVMIFTFVVVPLWVK